MNVVMETKSSGWNWSRWNISEKMLVSGLLATFLTLFLAWRDVVLIQRNGFESGEAWVALALVAYPGINVIRGKSVNKILAIVLTVLAVIWGLANIASNIETIEADGFLFEEDTTLDYNGIGAYMFVPISFVSMIGALLYRPPKKRKSKRKGRRSAKSRNRQNKAKSSSQTPKRNANDSAVVQQPSSVPFNIGPDVALVGTVDVNGYEWVVYNGANYWRLAGSGSNWTRHQ